MVLVAIAVLGKDLLKPACWRTGISLGITLPLHQIPGEPEFNAFARYSLSQGVSPASQCDKY
jgi:hypothetical protein